MDKKKKGVLINEKQFIHACINGDPEAQQYLFDQYAPKLLGVCARYCQNLDDARDAMQDGFIKIFRILNQFNFNSKLETWMTRIMINTAIDQYRKSSKFLLYESADQVHQYHTEKLEEDCMLDVDCLKNSKMNDILKLIQQLPVGYRLVFNLYAIEGYSHQEVAEELNISVGTSKSQLARARKALKGKLISEGIVER
jgi:RNA polymerase sigma factor (sigma-70 family)